MELFQVKKHIGKGNFGRVFQAVDCYGREFALKKLDKRVLDEETLCYVKKEIEIMSSVNHKNVVKCFFASENESSIFIAIEMCYGGDLESYLKKFKPKKKTLRKWLRGLVEGLDYLHSRGIIHRDLKLANFLVSSKEEDVAECKLADFGFAKRMDRSITATQLGSPLFMAPEIFRNDCYDMKADIWSLGTALYELLIGKPLYECTSLPELIQAHQREIIIESSSKLSSHYKLLLCQCLSLNPEDRPTCKEILQMSCFSDHFKSIEDEIEELNYEEQYDFLDTQDLESSNPLIQEDLNKSEYFEDYEEIAFSAINAEIELMILEQLRNEMNKSMLDKELTNNISNFLISQGPRLQENLNKIRNEFGSRCEADGQLRALLNQIINFQAYIRSLKSSGPKTNITRFYSDRFIDYCMSFVNESNIDI